MSNKISSITKGPRESNFELLRIIAMFLVLVVHADFYSIGTPTSSDFIINPLNAITRTFFEAISIVCVNVFILISGWFSIKPKIKGLFNFFFQCLYFYIGIYIIGIVVFNFPISLTGIRECFFLSPESGWFVISYTGLYIISPILNNFINQASRKNFLKVVLAFYIFQTYCWLGNSAPFLTEGYSTFSFIGLYLLASYLKRYQTKISKIGGGSLSNLFNYNNITL